ncbi:MAG TPA: hypothetical protein VK698_26155 [Kofleriaceae bacterium]|nr:hypothetical protein [Kofleriaceae bacterium]
MRRNPPNEGSPGARFSLPWVVVSYFLICGGLCAAVAGYALTRTQDPYVIAAALFVGAAVGGFLAGQASPHRSYAEPVLAALLVVGSVVAFVYSTPLGRVLVEQHRDQVVRVAFELGGVGALGGLLGAIVGEATQPAAHGVHTFGWVIQGIFISAGALFSAGILAALILLNEAAQAAVVQTWTGGGGAGQPLLSEDRLTLVAVVTGATASFLGGLITQLGAPRRALFPAALGAALIMGGAVMGIGWAARRATELVGAAAIVAAMAGVIALVGALISFLIGRATGRLSSGGAPDLGRSE